MKFRITSLLLISFFLFMYNCKTAENSKYADILSTKNTSLIEDFLENSNKNDSRRAILKSRLIALKNAELQKKTTAARQLVAKPIFTEIPQNYRSNSGEAAEFKSLMQENSTSEHQQKTVKLLNAMFDQDISSKEAILLVQNKSDCNMILRLEGKGFYNLAIPMHSENSLVLPKGDYNLSSNVCDVKYNSTKKIVKNMMVTLSNPTLQKTMGVNNVAHKSQK